MHNTVVVPYVIDKRFQVVRPWRFSLETVGKAEALPRGFPKNLNAPYRRVQNWLRWEEVSLEYRYIADPAFDIFSFVPQELKEQDLQGGQPAILKDSCRLLGMKGEILLRVQRREVLYVHNSKESTETMLQEGTSVRDAMRRCADNTVYAVLYRQFLYGQLTAAILHVDREGKALQVPE